MAEGLVPLFFHHRVLPTVSIAEEYEEEEVVYEEPPQPHVIETGDSLKVKQVLDDAVMNTVGKA